MLKKLILLFLIVSIFSGCGSLLPSIDKQNTSTWETYDDIEKSFEQIEPLKTTKEQLHSFGFDPFKNKNIKLLNYLDIMNKFLISPSISLDDLNSNLSQCLKKHNSCYGYEIKLEVINQKRYGSVFLDLFNFERKTQITGWDFNAIIVFDNGTVVYKISNGDPNVNVKEEKRNPLGPFQSMESVLRTAIE